MVSRHSHPQSPSAASRSLGRAPSRAALLLCGLALLGPSVWSQPGQIDWTTDLPQACSLAAISNSNSNIDGIAVTVTGTKSMAFGGSARTDQPMQSFAGCPGPLPTQGANFVTHDTDVVAGATDYLLLGMDGTNTDNSDFISITMTFDPPVFGIDFNVGDVDFINNFYRDLLLIEAFNSEGTPALVAPTTVNRGSAVSGSSLCPGLQANATCSRGTGNSAVAATDGNVQLIYPSSGTNLEVATLVVTYFAEQFANSEQWISLAGPVAWTASLPVVLTSVGSYSAGGQTNIAWTTASETLNAGFRVLGRSPAEDAEAEWREVALVPSADPDSTMPQDYEVNVAEELDELIIIDVDIQGRERRHGPFAVGTSYGESIVPQTIDWEAVKMESSLSSPLDRVLAAASASANSPGGGGEQPALMRFSASRRNSSPTPRTDGARLLVAEAGIQRVSYQALRAADVDLVGVDASTIAIVKDGRRVQRFVGGGSVFGPGSWIEFLAADPELTLWSPVDTYTLILDRTRVRRVRTRSMHGLEPPTVHTGVLRHDLNNKYSFASPIEPFYDESLLAFSGQPKRLERPFSLLNLEPGPVTLRLSLWGSTDFPTGGPDHHLEVRLNHVKIGDHRFDGITAQEFSYDVTSLVHELDNVLELELPGDTEHLFSLVNFDSFTVEYRRASVAQNGRFESVVGSRAFGVSGFGDGPVVGWIKQGRSVSRLVAKSGHAVRVPAARRGTRIWLATGTAPRTPGVQAGIPAPARPSSAELIIVAHPSFEPHLGPLVALEESRNRTVEVVTTDSIYAAYSGHDEHPEAIHSYLAASNRLGQLQFVLLVGGTTYDPYDHLGLGSVSLVPTAYVDLGLVRYAPSDSLFVDFDSDRLPDKPIGRIPATTAAELRVVVDKMYAWSSNNRALLTSGASDQPGVFPRINAEFGAALSGWQTTIANADEVGVEALRSSLLESFSAKSQQLEQKPSLISYVGHSSFGIWDFSSLLKWQDVEGFSNFNQPTLVAQWGCWNSYFVSPEIEVLSSHLLLAPDVGAVGVIGATTLTTDASHSALGSAFFAEIGQGAETVGEAFWRAKRSLADAGLPLDALYGMILLGSPTLPLNPPNHGRR